MALSRRLVQIWLRPVHSLWSGGRSGAKVLFDHDLFFAQLVGEDDHRGVDAVVDVDRLLLALAFVGVGFDGANEVGDPADALFDGVDQLHAGDHGLEPTERLGQQRPIEFVAGALELFGVHADRDQCGGHLPRVFDVVGFHPLGEGLFGIALFQRVHPQRLLDRESLLLKIDHAVSLFFGQIAFFELERELVHSHQVLSQLLRGTAGSGARVVQLVHQARGERPQRNHLLLLQGHVLHLLKALRHVGKNGSAHLWTAGHQAPELLLVELQEMAWHGGLEIYGTRDVRKKR